MQYRTDLAMERAADFPAMPGIETIRDTADGFSLFEVRISSEEAARQLGKARGRYVTIETAPLHTIAHEDRRRLSHALAQQLSSMLPPSGDIMVVGLGNRRITSDALGTQVTDGVLVTRHLKEVLPPSLHTRLRGVCALSPGVLGVTGMETAEIVQGAAERVKPAAIICVDALAARECARIGTTIQITDTGIQPGSGVGNHRRGLTKELLGVPVLAIGVPMVVYTSVIIRDALTVLLRDFPETAESCEAQADALSQRIAQKASDDMVVTPREIDQMVCELSQVIAMALNFALQPQLEDEEIMLLTNEAP